MDEFRRKGVFMDTIIEVKDLEKHFGSVVANRNISFKLKQNKVYALLGENGAGKSTLMNMLSGIYKPDRGEIYLRGERVTFSSPKDAIARGIGMIHQHFKLVENKSALDNIILGQYRGFFMNKKKIKAEVMAVCEEFGLNIDLDKPIEDMSISEKQTTEIIKVLYRGSKILILDEPTAVLTPQEIKNLFRIMNNMREKGCTLIIITHKLHEILEISDEVLIMRKGEFIENVITAKTHEKELTDLMVGESVDLKIERVVVPEGRQILQVRDLMVENKDGIKKINGISFTLREGEVLGVAGLAGSGQKELCEVLNGVQKATSGEIDYEGESLKNKTPREIIEKGVSMSFIPEDRLGMGLIASMSMTDNLILKNYYTQKGFFLSRKDAVTQGERLIRDLQIKTPGISHPVKQLSGGNIQKILLGRELDTHPHMLVTAYATRGLDVQSSHLIYHEINKQKQKNVGIIYVGEDLDVLMELCDRIMVLCDGEITGIVEAADTNREELGFLMGGKKLHEIKGADNV